MFHSEITKIKVDAGTNIFFDAFQHALKRINQTTLSITYVKKLLLRLKLSSL